MEEARNTTGSNLFMRDCDKGIAHQGSLATGPLFLQDLLGELSESLNGSHFLAQGSHQGIRPGKCNQGLVWELPFVAVFLREIV